MLVILSLSFFFFFQAEVGIRDATVTGVQTCALPICPLLPDARVGCRCRGRTAGGAGAGIARVPGWDAGARAEVDVVAGERCRAGRADDGRDGVVAAGPVREQHRGPAGGSPAVSPGDQCHQRRHEVDGLGCRQVFVAVWMLLVAVALDHALIDEGVQPCLEDVAGDADVVVDLVEAIPAEADVPQDQQRPPLADDLECPGQRAGQRGKVSSVHCIMLLTAASVVNSKMLLTGLRRRPERDGAARRARLWLSNEWRW